MWKGQCSELWFSNFSIRSPGGLGPLPEFESPGLDGA